MPFFDKKCQFSQNCWSDRSKNLQVGAQEDFEKLKFEKGGCMENLTFLNEKNSVPPPIMPSSQYWGNKKLVEHANSFPGKNMAPGIP